MSQSKELVAASATPMILAILSRGETYGYAIIREIREVSETQIEWTDGMLYPVLHRLERQGLVAAKWRASESGRKRKYYHVTKHGLAQLAAQREQWHLVDNTLRCLWMKTCKV